VLAPEIGSVIHPQQPPPQHPAPEVDDAATEAVCDPARPPRAIAVKTRVVSSCPWGHGVDVAVSVRLRRTSKEVSQVRQR
jgi:hypothetical protein